MRVFLTGANGVMGRASIHALRAAGHEVVGLVRSPENAALVQGWGAAAVIGDVLQPQTLEPAMRGCDVVVNFATKIPVGYGALMPGSLTELERIRRIGAGHVAEAAIRVGASRIIQQSLSLIYVDGGDEWIDESSAIDVTSVADPLVVAEDHARSISAAGGTAVCLRYGLIAGDDANSRFFLKRAAKGRTFGLGDPASWQHLVHPDDIGTSVIAALTAPAGSYNVGAEPVTRAEYVATIAQAAGRDSGRFLPRWVHTLGGDKLEMLTRSQRVSSRLFTDSTGWKPARPHLTPQWFR